MALSSLFQRSHAPAWPALLPAAILLGCLVTNALAQEPAAPAPATAPAAAPGPFAPGVLTTIAPDMSPEETVSTHDLVEFRADPSLNWNPEFLAATRTLFGMSQGVKFRRDVSCLEFSFKPLRMISVDVPQASGRMQKKLIWYMVYRVRNTGQILKPVAQEGSAFAAELAPGPPLRFLPHFVLESQDRQPTGERTDKAYLDRVIPVAMDAIRRREMRGQPLLNSVEMAQQTIPVSTDRIDRSVWGVAMWEDVDPRIDFFSIYVGGLSNAYGWEDNPAAAKPGMQPGSGRSFVRKMLQLNFFRPGDEVLQDEREIRYGVPVGKAQLYDVADGVAYRWVYR
ncbi:MAG: hypothetical protein WD669_07965 [Pirellulales bacterium]